MKFEQPKNLGNNVVEQEKKDINFRDQIRFPHIEPIIKALEKHFPKEGERVNPEVIKDIFYTYLEQKVNNTHIYKSERYNVSFPWSLDNTADLAKSLYTQYSGGKNIELKPRLSAEQNIKDKEFIFTNFFSLEMGGNEFVFQEEVMHKMIGELPRAIEMLQQGEEPAEKEIFTLGSPTNENGLMSEEFIKGIEETSLAKQYGLLYAEFIENNINKEKNMHISLRGISMAGGFAVETADKLIKDGAVTQSHEIFRQEKTPIMQIRIDVPPGQVNNDRSKIIRWVQIGLGFLGEGAYDVLTNDYLKAVTKGDKDFISDKNKMLQKRGIYPNKSKEQEDMKKKVVKKAIKAVLNGVPVPHGLKITQVIGKSDPLTYSPNFNTLAQKQKTNHTTGDIRENIVSQTDTTRKFGINMRHMIPYLRENELKRIQKAAKLLEKLKNNQE